MKQLVITIDNDEQVEKVQQYLNSQEGVLVEENIFFEEIETEKENLKNAILKSLQQVDNGETVTWEQVKKEMREKYNFPITSKTDELRINN